MMIHTKSYSGLDRRKSERRSATHRRDLVRYEGKRPRRTGQDRRTISKLIWDLL